MSPAIGHALVEGTAYLKLAGELRHDNVGALDSLVEIWFGGGRPPQSLVIDLTSAEFMDSTALGLLAACLREARAAGLPKPLVFSIHPDINALLRGLRFDEACTLIEQRGDRALPAGALHSDGLGLSDPQTILRAHEALIDLNEANRAAFQSVVDLFRSELR